MMIKQNQIILLLLLSIWGCGQQAMDVEKSGMVDVVYENKQNTPQSNLINPEGQTIHERFLLPDGYARQEFEENSFAHYLRHLPLKPHGTEVQYYNGNTKPNHGVYLAVIDRNIGKRDLHQCADAIMRLRAEYLWEQQAYDQIHFNFTNGFRVDYSKWMQGNRVVVKGNKSHWTSGGQPSNTYKDFWKYMELIFSYAGTLSLEKELMPVKMTDLQIGDVFIQGGSPGHAVIVVDVAINQSTGEKLFMLAQSYMPAQEIQILQNPNDENISPWYRADFGEVLNTPEWTFRVGDLKRFDNEGID